MESDIGFPILVILTNKECSHCVKMRGRNGWPSFDLPPTFFPKKASKNKLNVWDENFFKSALRCGIPKSTQLARVIELNFDTLKSNSKLVEITFFDLSTDNKSLIVKKYRESDNGKTIALRHNKNGFVDSNILKISFQEFIKTYIPLKSIRRYVHIFPSFMYVHSSIWDTSIEDDGPFYARVQGFKTIRDGDDHNIYKIMKEKKSNIEERDKNPIDILRKLAAFELVPLYFPSDH